MITAKRQEDPVLRELDATLLEWHPIFLSLYLDDQAELFERIRELIIELTDAREDLIRLWNSQAEIDSSKRQLNESEEINLQQQISELKADIISKLDLGNQNLGLDLVIRNADFEPVDPVCLSPVKLYQLHVEKVQNEAHSLYHHGSNNNRVAAGQQHGNNNNNYESNSTIGASFYSAVSQTGSDLTHTTITSSSGHQRHHDPAISYHLQLALQNFSIALFPKDELFEIYFCLVELINNSSNNSIQQQQHLVNPISEKLLIKIKNDEIVKDCHRRTIFTNIGPLKGRGELGLSVQVYRNGKMILSEISNKTSTFGKQTSNSNLIIAHQSQQDGSNNSINNAPPSMSKYNPNGLIRSRHSTIGGIFVNQSIYKRPFGTSFISITNNQNQIIKNPFKDFVVTTKVSHISNESEFYENFYPLNANRKAHSKASSNQASIQLELALKVLACKQESIPRVTTFNLHDYCYTDKRGFPDIVMPGDFKNELYLTLEGAEFEKGGKSIPKNIEASVSLINRSGLVIEQCIEPASNCDKVSSYRSCIFYHSNSPRWNESIKINVPLTEFDKAHIRIEFRHCSTKDREKKFLGFCFLPLSDQDGTVIPDKAHDLYLYKCDSAHLWEDDPVNLCKYLSLAHGPQANNSSGSSSNNGSTNGINTLLSTNNNQSNSIFSHSNREIVTVNTFLLSTKLTQNRTLLNLLKWRELIKRNNSKDFEDTLNNVLMLKGEEIVKFLQDILDTLFDTFTLSLSNEGSGLTALIFKVLVHIFLLLDEPKYQHFKPVLDTYASAHFSATLVYKGLLALLLGCVQKCRESASSTTSSNNADTSWHSSVQKCFKTIKYVFQFIVQSKILLSQATGNQVMDEQFHNDLKHLLGLIEKLLESSDLKLMALQETLLESFAGAIEQLARIMDPFELAKYVKAITSSVDGHLTQGLSRSKLVFMRDIAASNLLMKKKKEARLLISEVFCRQSELYLKQFESLELCHEVLEILIVRIHDLHWPTILKTYQSMLKGNPGEQKAAEQPSSPKLMTIGELNLYPRLSAIQANQLDLAMTELAKELEPYVRIMELLLGLLDRLVRDLNNDRPIIQRCCTCLLTIMKLMGKASFDLFLSHRINYEKLCDLFKSLRAVYNRDWSIMQLTSHAILEHPIDEISRDFRMEINENPSAYVNLIVDFITHPTLQLESFSERKKNYIMDVFGDLRLKLIDQLVRFWNGLSKMSYCSLIPTSMQSFLDAALLPNDEIQQRIMPVFYDMIDAEDTQRMSFRQIELCMIENLDLFLNLDRGDTKFIENFSSTLKSLIQKKAPSWEQRGLRLIYSFTKLMQLLVDYRQSLVSYDQRSKQMICLVDLLSFYKDLNRMDIYLKYLFKLSDINLESSNFTEAGFTLKLYADELRWSQASLPALDGFRPEEQEWRRKEVLYQRIISYFDLGKCWEESISLCKELATFYELNQVDYEKLSAILKRRAQLLDNILNELRPEREYFRVEYLGSDLPDFIRGKEFIYRGDEYERLAAFIQRVTKEFPDAKVLTTKSKKSLAPNCSGQFMIISNVKPVPFLQDTFKAGQRIVNDKVIQYYLNNRLDTFSYDVPILKQPASSSNGSAGVEQSNGGRSLNGANECSSSDQQPAMNMRNLWVGRCMLKVRKQLPDILPWSEVISQVYIEISPVTNAIETISSMNVELSKLILCYSKEPGQALSPLTMRLQGVLEASVNGGPAVIMNAFFRPRQSMQENVASESLSSSSSTNTNKQPDQESLIKLRNLIKQQFTLLETGLNLHSRLAPPEVMPLQARLVERLAMLKRTFVEESSQIFEETTNVYETVNHHVAKLAASSQTSSDLETGNSSKSSSVVDEVDGFVASNLSSSTTRDMNGNLFSQSDSLPTSSSNNDSSHTEQATYSRPSEALISDLRLGAAQRIPAANSIAPSAGRNSSVTSTATMSSSSTCAILSNLPQLSNSATLGCSNHRHRISLTPTKEMMSTLQLDGSAANKAARRLTFASNGRLSADLLTKQAIASGHIMATLKNPSAASLANNLAANSAPPPLPPRLIRYHPQQAQDFAGKLAARQPVNNVRSPMVPPRQSSPHQNQHHQRASSTCINKPEQ